MAAETRNFPLRAHHLDFAFSMTATLGRLGKKDIQLSQALRPLLSDNPKLNYNELTENDHIFLGLLMNIAWIIRKVFTEKTKSSADYDKDVVGINKALYETYIDRLTLATSRSILAIFLPHMMIEIGDVLDGHCLACAVAEHCGKQMNDDLAILIQLRNFIKGVSEPTPKGGVLELKRADQVDLIDAEIIRAFLMDRVDSVIIDNLVPEDGVIIVPMIARGLLMAKKRTRTGQAT